MVKLSGGIKHAILTEEGVTDQNGSWNEKVLGFKSIS